MKNLAMMAAALLLPGIAGAASAATTEAVVWKDAANVSVSGSALSKSSTATPGFWNAGASSSRAIAAGYGYVAFTAGSGYYMVGLSHGDSNHAWADVDFGIYLTGEGTFSVQEGLAMYAPSGSYAPGDTFRVEVSAGGTVYYVRNGVPFYTSTRTPTYPLLVDTSIYTGAPALTQVALHGTLVDSPPMDVTTLSAKLFWQHPDGRRLAWLLNGATKTGEAAMSTSSGWRLTTAGDFNADSRADVISSEVAGQGNWHLTYLDGVMSINSGFLAPMADTAWRIKGTGDFNGDGKTDIVWRHGTTGHNLVWYMNGAASTGSASLASLEPSTWDIVGTGDFDRDGKTDLLWRNSVTGQNAVWHLNGVQTRQSTELDTLADPTWKIVGAGDFNGDDKADILWWNEATSELTVWYMDNVTRVAEVSLPRMTESGWRPVAYVAGTRPGAPTLDPEPGSFPEPMSVTVGCPLDGSVVRYTTDGTEPVGASTTVACRGTIPIAQTTTLKLVAWRAGLLPSPVVTAKYTITGQVPTPTIDPPGGLLTSPQDVIVRSALTGATLRYTLNGSEPTDTDTPIESGESVRIDHALTLKVKAWRAGLEPSATASAVFDYTILAPVFAPPAGTFVIREDVVLSATPGAVVRYTTDGSEPDATSTLYSGPIAITAATTIRAKAFQPGLTPSPTAVAAYTPAGPTTEAVTQWRNKVNVTFTSGNTFYKSGGAYDGWDAGASSVKAIAGGTGWVSFTAPGPLEEANDEHPAIYAHVSVGLSNGDTNQNPGDIDYRFVLNGGENNYLTAVVNGTAVWGGWHAWYGGGDGLRIEIAEVSGQKRVRFYWTSPHIGGTVMVYEAPVTPVYPLVVDTAIGSMYGYVQNVSMHGILTAGSKPIAAVGGPYAHRPQELITFDGSGSYAVEGTLASYNWAFGDGTTATGPVVSHAYAVPGTYDVRLTVVDSGGRSATASTTATVSDAAVTESVAWRNVVNAASAGGSGSLWKQADTGQWDSGAASRQSIARGSGWFEFTTWYGSDFVAGLSNGDRTQDPAEIDFGIWLQEDSIVAIRENGATLWVPGPDPRFPRTYGSPQRFRVEVDDSGPRPVVHYYHEFTNVYGEVVRDRIHTSTQVPVYPLNVDVSFKGNAAIGNPVLHGSLGVSYHPVASLGGPYSARPHEVIAFDGRGSYDASGGSIVSYLWDFGDGALAATATPTHTYTAEGSYTLRLTVVDNDGYASSATGTVTISDAPVSETVMWRNIVGLEPLPGGGGGLWKQTGTVAWDAGASSKQAIAHGAGWFEFTPYYTSDMVLGLNAGDRSVDPGDIDFGLFLTGDGDVWVREGTALIGPFGTYGSYQRFRIAVNLSNGQPIVQYARDGVIFYTSARTPGYPLVADVSIYANGGGFLSPVLHGAFTPRQLPVAAVGGPYAGRALDPITFDGRGSYAVGNATIVSYAWELGDGVTATGPVVTQTYDEDGTRTVRLTVTDSGGLTATGTTTLTIAPPTNWPPKARAGGPYGGRAGDFIFFDGTTSTDRDGTIVRYTWDFGDGETGDGAQPQHVYSEAKTYLVKLTVEDDKGGTHTDSVEVPITPGPRAEPVFWTRAVGVRVSGPDLWKESIPAAPGFNAGAVSAQALKQQGGWAEFQVIERNTARVFGLSHQDGSPSDADIERGIRLNADGTFVVVQGTQALTPPAPYKVGDVFRLELVEGGLQYQHNGAVIFTGPAPATLPVMVDVSLSTPAATIANARVGGAVAAAATGPGSGHTQKDGATAKGLEPGAPAGAYALSDLEAINYFNGSLSFALPLLKIGGRGQAQAGIVLPIQRQWVLESHLFPTTGVWSFNTQPDNYFWSGPAFERGTGIFHLGTMELRHIDVPGTPPTCQDGQQATVRSLTHLIFKGPDGTEMTFRDKGFDGEPQQTCMHTWTNRGRIWISGSATFVSDQDILDRARPPRPEPVPGGNLYLADGTRLLIQNGKVRRITDSNGNFIEYQEGPPAQIVDSLNRTVTFVRSHPFPAGDDAWAPCGTIHFAGFGGSAREIKIQCTNLEGALERDEVLGAHWSPGAPGDPGFVFNPIVVSGVVIPDGRQYTFRYNTFGELVRVVLPTEGSIEYVHAAGLPSSEADNGKVEWGGGGWTAGTVYRRVVQKKVFDADHSLVQTTDIGRTEPPLQGPAPPIEVQVSGASGPLRRELHQFESHAIFSMVSSDPLIPEGWRVGREVWTEIWAPSGERLQRTDQTWEQCTVPLNGDSRNCTPDPPIARTRDPHVRVTKVTRGTAVTKTEFHYDTFNNKVRTLEYAFVDPSDPTPDGQSQTTVFRQTDVAYKKDADYISRIDLPPAAGFLTHLRALPTQQTVSVPVAGQLAKFSDTTFQYDTKPLVARGGAPGWTNPNNPRRGNLTEERRWLLDANNPPRWIVAVHDYDVLGNRVKTTDARNQVTSVEFGSETAFALPKAITNALGHEVLSEYDLLTGLVTRQTDANGVVTTYDYDDVLDRLTDVVQAEGRPERRATRFSYDDNGRVIGTVADLDDEHQLRSESVYDGLGRTVLTRKFTPEGPIEVRTEYEALGPVRAVSNPHRQGDPVLSTVTEYDALDRVRAVETPDGARTSTEFAGASTTVTDPAGKRRTSETDALGRIIQITEDPGGLSLVTEYTYDPLDNLLSVHQGEQVRTFEYDSLSRLQAATNPESGRVTYDYDDNGNMTLRTDARGIETHSQYDALDRVRSVQYVVPPALGPDVGATFPVSYSYDNVPNGVGRQTQVVSGGAATAIDSYDALGRVLSHRQLTGGRAYGFEYGYNAAGLLTHQTYPSGLTVTTEYDSAGRIRGMRGAKPSGLDIAFIEPGSVLYAPHGGIEDMVLGNGLHESTGFDANRLQPTSRSVGSVLNLTWGYGGSDNNGNVLEHTINLDGWSRTQSYEYDPLNRLKSATEAGSWNQVFDYDRYGNRWVESGLVPSPLTPRAGNAFNTAKNQIVLPDFVHDEAGNQRQAGPGTAFKYDAEARLVLFSRPGAQARYDYDGAGRRVLKTQGSSTRTYIYDAFGHLATEHAIGGTQVRPVRDYVFAGDRMLASVDGSGISAAPVTPPKTLGPKGPWNNCAPDLAFVFHWEPTLGATQYKLKIDDTDFGTFEAFEVCKGSPCGAEPEADLLVEPFAPGTHTWTVQAVGLGWQSDWAPLTEYVVSGPRPPNPISPRVTVPTPLIEGGRRIQYKWMHSVEALQYTVWLDDQKIGTFLPADKCVAGVCTAELPMPGLGSHSWRVKATFPNCPPEVPSLHLKFRVDILPAGDVPVPLYPFGKIYTRRPLFRWRAALGATTYQVIVDGQVPEPCANCGPITCYEPTNECEAPAKAFQLAVDPARCEAVGAPACEWRVRAVRNGVEGAWSDALSFIVEPFELFQPPNGSVVSPPKALLFRWTIHPDATEYRLKVMTAGGLELVSATVPSAECADGFCSWGGFDHSFVPVPGPYKWNVQAFGPKLIGAQETDTWTFSVEHTAHPDAPVALRPSGTIHDRQPLFEWEPSRGAESYELEVDGVDLGRCGKFCDADRACSDTLCTLDIGRFGASINPARCAIDGDPACTWKVIAWNESGPSQWSNSVSFTVEGSFDLDYPGNNQRVMPPSALLFRWTHVPIATQYVLRVDGPGGPREWFMSPADCHGGYCARSAVSFGWTPALGRYTWTVQALGVPDEPTAGPRSFTIENTPFPNAPEPLEPSGTITTNRPTFKWRTDLRAEEYELDVEGINLSNCGKVCENHTSCVETGTEKVCQMNLATIQGKEINVAACANDGDPSCRWRVVAWNDEGPSQWSRYMSFTVETPPPPPTCGALGGTYCGAQPNSCPQGFESAGQSSDCASCCKESGPPPPGECQARGGDYCSTTDSCPRGYESLGESNDCTTCCKRGPSCGALGGDFCSPQPGCPAGKESLGSTYDCETCCKDANPLPTCQERGGTLCKQTPGCPNGYDALPPVSDCVQCCVMDPGPNCGDGDCIQPENKWNCYEDCG